MRIVIQRVGEAGVCVDGEVKGEIGKGMMVLVGVEAGDTLEDAEWLAKKTAGLRIFSDDEGVMNLSIDHKVHALGSRADHAVHHIVSGAAHADHFNINDSIGTGFQTKCHSACLLLSFVGDNSALRGFHRLPPGDG